MEGMSVMAQDTLDLPMRGDALVDQAYAILRARILGNELLSGARLSVPKIADELQISRSPAREAIQRLIYEGLADYSPGRGARVARLNIAELIEVYKVRSALEALAAAEAARRIDDETVELLADILRAHREAVDVGDVSSHARRDMQFHRTVREVTGNATLQEYLERLQSRILLGMGTTHTFEGGMRQALREHEEIFAALQARDPRAAEDAARGHIERLVRELEERRKAGES
ncbi:hypothetical protein SA2016_0897 [Sinomonas atrocyanea]|uniref:HTH gntR-type domain-containing protein n=2 Tax=Sinomonas atrocyanea TaxID=37927 RepID=A0A126ZYV7_9MICC|nr:hypothetical protein SA2016_0897 [Sinomonas atrocyanea]